MLGLRIALSTFLELAEPAVMLRPPWTQNQLITQFRERDDPRSASFWIDHLVDVPYLDISATMVRDHLENHEDLTDLLSSQVIEYLASHGLYQT